MAESARTVRPVLKWPGGKYRLLEEILPRLPAGKRYVEPFVGSGAVFLNCGFSSCLLADLNADLILFHKTLVRGGAGFVEACQALFTDGNDPETYYARRERFNELKPGAERAALFLYFNRHGYNGLIRYNAEGRFNVPFGRYVRPYFPKAEMEAFLARGRRRGVTFKTCDFRGVMEQLGEGDVAYCDPPYVPLSRTANFTGYSGASFGMEEQRALARLAEQAADRGARVVISNHDVPETRELYRGATERHVFSVRRNISCNTGKRELAPELLVVY